MSSATEAVTNAAFAGIANANGAPRRTSQPVRSASAHRTLMPAATGAESETGRVVIGSSLEDPSGLLFGPRRRELKREPEHLLEPSKGDPGGPVHRTDQGGSHASRTATISLALAVTVIIGAVAASSAAGSGVVAPRCGTTVTSGSRQDASAASRPAQAMSPR